MTILPRLFICVLLIKFGYGKQDASCVIGGMHVPGCNENEVDEDLQAELLKEKEEIQKEKEEKEKNMTEEERESEKKKEYKKLFFTNNYDWNIRDELDAADLLIHNDTKKAIEAFEDILSRHPSSPRAKYALIRSKVYFGEKLDEDEEKPSTEQAKKYWEEGVEDYLALMKEYEPLPEEVLANTNDTFRTMKFKVPYSLFQQCIMHATDICDKGGMTRKAIEVLESAMKFDNSSVKNHRYHRILIQYYMYIVDELSEVEVAALENTFNRTIENFPKDAAVDFYKGIFYKLTDRKKEGGKILRSIPLAEGRDNSEFTHQLSQIGQVLYVLGKNSLAEMIYQEGSRQHLFLTPYQRPLLFLEDIETKPIWPADVDGELDDGLIPYKKQLKELLGSWTSIRDEALAVGKNISSNLNWIRYPYTPTNPGTLVTEPKDKNTGPDRYGWDVFPLYMWGKKKNTACANATTTCTLLKNNFQDATKCPSCTVKFIRLDPKVNIQPLCAPGNDRLRIYLGLSNSDKLKYVIQGGSPKEGAEVPMVDGKLQVVDESHAHSLLNTSEDVPVYVLGIDFYHPNLPVKWLEGETKKEGLALAEHAHSMFFMH